MSHLIKIYAICKFGYEPPHLDLRGLQIRLFSSLVLNVLKYNESAVRLKSFENAQSLRNIPFFFDAKTAAV